MAEAGGGVLDRLGGDPSRRFALAGVIIALVVGVGLIGRWAATPTYVPLYNGLDLKESGEIAEKLGKTNVPFRLVAGGATIEVPAAEVARARVALAKDGLPSAGRPGLELFDKPTWGMTDFTQRVTFQRALEGELARTIGSIQGIERAEVHLLIPNPGPVRRTERPAGASVVLTLKGGLSLGPETVQGITYIVSNSVEQLSAENVAVIDDAGRVLSAPSSSGASPGMTGRQIEVQRGVEQSTVDKIVDLVGTVVGVGRVRAQVSALMAFDQVDATTETYDPEKQVLSTEQRSETTGGESGNGQQTVVSNQYANSRRVEKSTVAAGRLAKLTVAVLVDDKALRPGEREREMSQIEAMVRNAVGIDSTRGDRLSVLAVPFEPVVLDSARVSSKGPKADPVAIAERFSRPAVGVAAILVMLVLANTARGLLLPAKGVGGASVANVAAVAPPPSAVMAASGLAAEALPAREDGEVAKLKHWLKQESAERPEVTAQVLRAWIAESN